MTKDKDFEYVHLPQSEDLGPEGRSYRATERVIEFKDKKILILETQASDMSFCDSSYACQLRSILVKGYVKKWKYRRDAEGTAISVLETMFDNEEKKEIHDYLHKIYNIENILIQTQKL